MRIDIWSDVVCPWCYIGKRRLEGALADFPHAAEVEIVWHSFQLDPGAPTEPTATAPEHLAQKLGGGIETGRQMIVQVEAAAAEEGMIWRHHESRPVNTLDAHRLLHLALAEVGPAAQGALKEALLSAYFTGAANLADHDTLRTAALGAGLDAARVDAVLGSQEFRDAVLADQDQAYRYGANGVPFYVLADKYGVSGAQPAAVFAQALERAWTETHPQLEMVQAGDSDGACGPDGCAV